MIVAKTIAEVREAVFQFKKDGFTVGFVPTMGALHSGHISLMQKMSSYVDKVVVSVFVNPTQFGPNEDYNSYPRQIEKDLEKCRKQGVSAVFLPDEKEVYSKHTFIRFQLDGLGDHLCGTSRPGHFHGVIQIVNKFFNIVEPHYAIFGQKDIQQFYVLKRMAREFNHGITILMGETMRHEDGLAMSSRNEYLNEDERLIAPLLYENLQRISAGISDGIDDFEPIRKKHETMLEQAGFSMDYLSLVDNKFLRPIKSLLPGQPAILAIAAFLGKTRLIDNVLINHEPD